jgi:7-cyano-7-deazaguanine tRNA-ribosyltransferase
LEINSRSNKLSRSPVAFEVRCTDLAARIGRLETPHGIIETPAFVPVVHPVRQTVSPKFLKSLGFNAIITNSYITLEQCGDRARKKGIHDIVNFDGVVMTDSGGYQVLEYGGINVEANVIAKFEKDIGSDICVPLDKPTGYGLDYATARNYVEQTLTNAKDTLPIILEKSKDKSLVHNKKENHMQEPIWAGPIQGAEHLDLVRYSASELDKMGFTLMALGSPVEIMEAYEFSTLARMIASAKSVVPTKPLHLFGAGHPLTIPLAVALGCDMFDSASYILYAKDNRYMHANGTARLDDLTYLPCRCPVCNEYNSAKELLENDVETRITEVAKHNLYVLKTELNSVKQAIVDGRLWEYVLQKSRAHPRLLESVEILKNFELLRQGTPIFKQKAVFFFDPIDQFRPEAVHFREMVSKFRSGKRHQGIRTLILYPEPPLHPFYATQDFKKLAKKFPEAQICTYNQFLGIIPAEISDIFPAAHNLAANVAIYQTYDYQSFVDSFKDFLSNNKFDEIIIIADQFFRNIIINDRSVLDKIDAKVFDYTQDAISEIQACRS